MPRKGWSTVQVPDGWLQIIRGPRPQSSDWRLSSRSLQRQGQEQRKLPRKCLPILPTSFKNCERVSRSCGKRIRIFVRSCSPVEATKSENANSQEVWQVPRSNWPHSAVGAQNVVVLGWGRVCLC